MEDQRCVLSPQPAGLAGKEERAERKWEEEGRERLKRVRVCEGFINESRCLAL